ncbi:MAG: TylF/MycF/NovP-related O-methyltransferase [Pseudomonadota bacterium]
MSQTAEKAIQDISSAPREMQIPLEKLATFLSMHFRSTLVWSLRDVEVACYSKATEDTADYVVKNMLKAKIFRGDRLPKNRGRFEVLEDALREISLDDGLVLEFGVYKGETLVYIANMIDTYVYGFDAFEGLPENWFFEHIMAEFDLKGKVPDIKVHRDNVRLVKGWFNETLPDFIKNANKSVKFLHIDCDIYSSTKTIFDGLKNNIVAGTIIVFDEYFNYPGWREHEFKAFQEYVKENDVVYEYISYAPKHYSVAVKILKVGK